MALSPSSAPEATDSTDVLIVGGGAVGLAAAVALKAAAGRLLRVQVWDPQPGRRSAPQRTSALAPASVRLLETLGVWRQAAEGAGEARRIEITDTRLEDVVRPLLLSFGARRPTDVIAGAPAASAPLAHIIVNAALEAALEARAAELGVVIRRASAASARAGRDVVAVVSGDGATVRARLLVAADGARSPLREAMGLSILARDYRAVATVCTVEHERPHEGRAVQHFLPEGPFARLPLAGRRSSIVWSAPARTSRWLAALPPDVFAEELARRFGRDLGAISIVDAPLRFPLRFQLARRFTSARFALVGDAAHVVHPLAGQGLNLGLRDVDALARIVASRARLGLDPGAPDVMDLYASARHLDTLTMSAAHDALQRLFAAEGVWRPLRDWGLGLVDRSPKFKAQIIREAAGPPRSAPASRSDR